MLNDLVSDPVGAALKMDPGCTAQFVEQFAYLVPSTAEFEAARRCCGDGPLLTVAEDFVLRCGRVPDLGGTLARRASFLTRALPVDCCR